MDGILDWFKRKRKQPATGNPAQPAMPQTLGVNGIMLAQTSFDEADKILKATNVKLVRLAVFLSNNPYNRNIDLFLKAGYNVQININWAPAAMGANAYVTDLLKYRSRVVAFCEYYKPYIKQIPVVAVENEWDNVNYYVGPAQDYINALAVATDILHQYGYKVAEGAITGTGLSKWYYYQAAPAVQKAWMQEGYFVGKNNPGYEAEMKRICAVIEGLKNVQYDYANAHWYNHTVSSNGYLAAASTYAAACGKEALICNEYGIKSNSLDLFKATFNEVNNLAEIAIAYSGVNDDGKAIQLSNDMIKVIGNA